MKTKTIDTDVAIPEGWRRDRSRYGLETMNEGESYFTPCPEDNALKKMQCVHSSARMLTKKYGCLLSVATRAAEEGGVKGFRTWIKVNAIINKK